MGNFHNNSKSGPVGSLQNSDKPKIDVDNTVVIDASANTQTGDPLRTRALQETALESTYVVDTTPFGPPGYMDVIIYPPPGAEYQMCQLYLQVPIQAGGGVHQFEVLQAAGAGEVKHLLGRSTVASAILFDYMCWVTANSATQPNHVLAPQLVLPTIRATAAVPLIVRYTPSPTQTLVGGRTIATLWKRVNKWTV